jgi:hypothetical protein
VPNSASSRVLDIRYFVGSCANYLLTALQVAFSRAVRQRCKVPTGAVGKIVDARQAEQVLFVFHFLPLCSLSELVFCSAPCCS